MLKIDRHRFIEDILHNTGSITISDISAKLSCSEETIRRDLKEMEASGILKRTHGGAYLPTDEEKSIPLKLRELYIPKAKDLMAQIAIDNIIEDNNVIMLDSSSTCLHLAKMLLTTTLHITIITNSLSIISLFNGNHNNIKLIAIGGKYRDHSHSFTGQKAINAISCYLVDKSFISCSAIDIQNGLLDNSENECDIRRTMIKHSKNCILLVDHTKFSDSGAYIIDQFYRFKTVITDRKPSKEWEDFFNDNDITLLSGK